MKRLLWYSHWHYNAVSNGGPDHYNTFALVQVTILARIKFGETACT